MHAFTWGRKPTSFLSSYTFFFWKRCKKLALGDPLSVLYHNATAHQVSYNMNILLTPQLYQTFLFLLEASSLVAVIIVKAKRLS